MDINRMEEENILKLSYNQLKELAVEKNINPKLKKAQLVKLLLGMEGPSNYMRTEKNELNTNGRVTRASVLKHLDQNLNNSIITNDNSEKISFVNSYEASASATMAEKEQKIKRKGKRQRHENKIDIATNNFERSNCGKPLTEITNTDIFHGSEISIGNSSCDNSDESSNNKHLSNENSFNEKPVLTGTRHNYRTEVVSATCTRNPSSSEDSETFLNSPRKNEENPKKRRGRKKKNVIPDIIVSSFEDKVTVENILKEQTTEKCLDKYDSPISELEIIETAESNHNCNSDKAINKSKGSTRGRKGKRAKATNSLTINISTNTQTEEPNKILVENIPSLVDNRKPENCKVTDSECRVAVPQREPSQTDSGTENIPAPVLVRSSTFTLENKDSDPKDEQYLLPKRSNTFTISDEDADNKDSKYSMPKRSYTFTISDEGSQNKATQSQEASISKKSIGARILSSSKKLRGMKSSGKQRNQGSTVKKTITKTTATPGSLFKNKFGGARKAPNFKSIHQKLFNNMESLVDNQKRKLERAQALIQSPIPRCANLTPTSAISQKNNNVKTEVLAKVLTPSQKTSSATNSKTPVVNHRSTVIPKSTSTNRFGFNKKRMMKEVAKSVVGMKLPPVSLQKKKDEERALIQGVRMNKRFLLQMQMRQGKQ